MVRHSQVVASKRRLKTFSQTEKLLRTQVHDHAINNLILSNCSETAEVAKRFLVITDHQLSQLNLIQLYATGRYTLLVTVIACL